MMRLIAIGLMVLVLPLSAWADRPVATTTPLFLNVSPRPVVSPRSSPRIVRNVLSMNYKVYKRRYQLGRFPHGHPYNYVGWKCRWRAMV